jgi:lactobin A/cerein 7B family class IIb bacteriocin
MNAEILRFEVAPLSALHGAVNLHDLSEADLDDVSGGFAPLLLIAEGAVIGLAVVGAVAVGVAGTALVYKAATGKNLF